MNSTVVNHIFNIEPLQTIIIVLLKYLVHMNHTTFRAFNENHEGDDGNDCGGLNPWNHGQKNYYDVCYVKPVKGQINPVPSDFSKYSKRFIMIQVY